MIKVFDPSDQELMNTFGGLIMACDVDAYLKSLGKGASWEEREVLGNLKVSHLPSLTRVGERLICVLP